MFNSEAEKLKIEAEYKKIRARQLDDIKKVLELPEGRRFLWRILEEGRVLSSCYHDNSQTMAYYEGKRDVGLFVLSELTSVNKNALGKIQNEHFSEMGKNKRNMNGIE